MKIIDTHVHLFERIAGIHDGLPMRGEDYGRIRIGNRLAWQMPPSFEHSDSRVETLIHYMDWCNVTQALLMPNPLYGYDNEYYIQSISLYPQRLRGVALVDVLGGDQAARELQHIYDTTPLFGLKIEVNSAFQCWKEKNLLSPELQPVLDCCNQNHQPLFIHMLYREDIERVRRMARLYPHITWILAHMGADACYGQGYDESALDDALSLGAENEKIYFETSTVEFYFDEEYPFPTKTAVIEKAYRALGAERIMWGSDYPGLLVKGTYRQLIDTVALHCPSIPASAMEQILAGTADRLFFAKNAQFAPRL